MPTNTVDMTYKSSDGHNNEKKKRCKTTWMDRLEKAMSKRNLQPGQWEDRKKWKKGCGKRKILDNMKKFKFF